MEKEFDLNIDTKKNEFNNIRGLKQGDNNSVLNITLVQDSILFNLTGLTVRINYKRTDGKIFLQMADIVDPTEGKIKINILTQVLEKSGTLKADLSIFDKDNRKITSATFTMFVDDSVYGNDYIESKDLDLIQSAWTSENTRIKNEDIRIENEKDRVVNEGNRKTNENIRVKNEENRQQDYSKMNSRIDNLVLGTGSPAEVIDAHLDGATGEKYPTLKERLDNTSEKLKENATKETTLKDGIEHLDNAVDGILNINSIGGNTLYKREDGTYTDVWEENVELESVKNTVEVTSCGKNLFDYTRKPKRTYMSTYNYIPNGFKVKNSSPIPYSSITIEFYLKPLTTYTFSLEKHIILGTKYIVQVKNRQNNAIAGISDTRQRASFTTPADGYIVIQFACTPNKELAEVDYTNIQLEEGTTATEYEPYKEDKIIVELKEPLRALPNGTKDELQADGTLVRRIGVRGYQTGDEVDTELLTDKTNIYYELSEPTIEKAEPLKPLKCWKDGSLIINSNINPVVEFRYPTNLNSRLSSVEENTLNNSNSIKEQNAVNLQFDFRLTALENKKEV